MRGPKPRPWIEQLDIYTSGKSHAEGVGKAVKLSANENALGPSPKAVAAYLAEADNLHRYPDATYRDLRAGLAKKHAIPADQILCGVGSDEILKLACRAYLAPGDEVIFSRHSFMMYPIAAKAYGGVPVIVDDDHFTTSIDHILAGLSPKTRIIFIANPNNPTGSMIAPADIERLWQQIPDNVLLVLDGAYIEFTDQTVAQASFDLVAKADNVLITRTFSKFYGLAALRLGWGYGAPAIIQTLDRLRDPFNVPTPTAMAGLAALTDQDFEHKVRDHIVKWRQIVHTALQDIGLEPLPSVTNFILIRFPDGTGKTAEAANQFLLESGYILRWLPGMGLPDCLRLTLGTASENKAVIQQLTCFMER